jgi:hypothetical protein
MSFNVASLPVVPGGTAASFNVRPTTVATGVDCARQEAAIDAKAARKTPNQGGTHDGLW